ncbi:MAG: hypothetical protein JF609_04555 [Verrucomicrobia bacterium]|nr:hypothetical protein [Verrucomicrobiota bacterium]
MRENNLIFLISLLIVCVGTTFIALMPPPARPNISITLLGYTNDATGSRLASFVISNRGPATAYLYMAGRLLRFDPQIMMDSSTPGVNWHTMLDGGTAVPLTIPPPTNDSPWQLTINADPDVGLARRLNHMVTRTARRMPYDIHSDWITETSSNQIPVTSAATNNFK